jgi:hypothetical protein
VPTSLYLSRKYRGRGLVSVQELCNKSKIFETLDTLSTKIPPRHYAGNFHKQHTPRTKTVENGKKMRYIGNL